MKNIVKVFTQEVVQTGKELVGMIEGAGKVLANLTEHFGPKGIPTIAEEVKASVKAGEVSIEKAVKMLLASKEVVKHFKARKIQKGLWVSSEHQIRTWLSN